MNPEELAAIKARAEKATPGPWKWFGNSKHHNIYLATDHSGRVFVMGFKRWGMSGAQPTFQIFEKRDPAKSLFHWNGRIKPASELLVYEVDYRQDIADINAPDADFIAHARQDVPALLKEIERLREKVVEERAHRIRLDELRAGLTMEQAMTAARAELTKEGLL